MLSRLTQTMTVLLFRTLAIALLAAAAYYGGLVALRSVTRKYRRRYLRSTAILRAWLLITMSLSALAIGQLVDNANRTNGSMEKQIVQPLLSTTCPPSAPCTGPPGTVPGAGEQAGPSNPPNNQAAWLIGAGGVAVMTGIGLLVIGAVRQDKTLKRVGVVSLLGGFLSHATFIREFKLEHLLSIEHPSLDLRAGGPMIDAQRLLVLSGFDPGVETLPGMAEKISTTICPAVEQHAAEGGQSTIIIIGGTDRLPLTSRAQGRLESNFGLAEARASQARRQVFGCQHPPNQVLLLGAGPQDFLEKALPRGHDPGSAADRRIEIWALWRSATPVATLAQVRPAHWPPTALDILGYLIGIAMIACYVLERMNASLGWTFALACLASAGYAYLQGSMPFVLIEVIWAGVAIWHWRTPDTIEEHHPQPT